MRKQGISVVFTYSDIHFTIAMENVLNRGLKFSKLPLKLGITQVLVYFTRFERTMIWHEFWYGKDSDIQNSTQIFRPKKNNLPTNYKVPNGLKMFLGSVNSELMDPKSRNMASRNIPDDELEALLELIKLQKEGKIVIKPCDKGAGIIILNYSAYLEACINHLTSEFQNQNGSKSNYYVKVHSSRLMKVKERITEIFQEGYNNEILSKQEYETMLNLSDSPGKFYCTFKVHKFHAPGSTPPVRPISSGSGSIYENIGIYIEHHIKDLAKQFPSYL